MTTRAILAGPRRLCLALLIGGLAACTQAPTRETPDAAAGSATPPPAAEPAPPRPAAPRKAQPRPLPPPPKPAPPADPAPPLPPPDVSYMTDAIATQPPPGMVRDVQALVARLKRGGDLTLRLTAVAPPVAGREYAIGLAARVADTLRAYLRGQGVPQQRIIRSVIDPHRETVSADERVLVELRLMKN